MPLQDKFQHHHNSFLSFDSIPPIHAQLAGSVCIEQIVGLRAHLLSVPTIANPLGQSEREELLVHKEF